MVKFNRANEHTVCGAGDEVADTFMVDESGHGFAICGFSVIAGQDIFFFFRLAGLESAQPGFPASCDGGVFWHRAGRGVRVEKNVGWQGHGVFSFRE